jgi:hypothetical protein
MSIAALNWAFQQPIMGAAKAVLIVLSDYADQDGWSWPAMASLGFRAGCDARTAQRAIRQLVDAGLARIDAGTGRGHTNRYQVLHNQCVQPTDAAKHTNGHAKDDTATPFVEVKDDTTPPFIETRKGDMEAVKGDTTSRKGDTTSPEPLRTTKRNHQGGARARRAPAAPKWVWDEIQQEIGMRSLLLPPIPEPDEDNHRAYRPRLLQ